MRSETVFVVEDNSDDEYLTVLELKRVGFTNIEVARDGFDAITKLKTLTPDLVILDLRLPRIDGVEVLRDIKSSTRLVNSKVIVLSSSCDPSDKELCTKLGVDLQQKPFMGEI
jgi:CheY-like chemotaxis protein